ncbi:MAG: 2-amino-5-formylamino-6-ribosylaminopyrimidin-4(3H)-one 5'-monophosphate deformylase [Euryarchaeota archaeon]|jgi:2-amino-5-formylamino-6-ribosylaminopyrimidin-4(3H)-one 5'-monophosphate deformylase|uniref:2-amino-5-formylamino-6-ribosylaminopyrimidin- 4(3H)-one 5'-monophosphate deformylase n=1 Tax=Methanobacterium sp. MZD130B TaxID=3394378 RepID=UPI0009D11407|nr:2-amino-5-formylamino-6-ribosylaminopyrimidin-4(3H)-one 5'-monophosphate deformylase [Euryarchaeota archaeon]OPZ94281.1 MAG: Creatinine amidohydrolase [Firmicutes bacterium ADurb.Bin419]HHT19342.1 2-amino-5-formylamino-6-ribosylaminopyrimidin-4(3H)-one 5'-monophosphate deformylase [Methanobacterium sp.]
MIELRYSSGNVISPDVHKIGVLAVGSHLENHGAALPIDTDSKIAAYVALEASLRTGAKYVGVLYVATEYDYVKHGIHIPIEVLVNNELIPFLKNVKNNLNLESVVLVNAHGGNVLIKDHLKFIKKNSQLQVVFNNKIVEVEGPHAGTGELSMGAVLGIVDEKRLDEHCKFNLYPEVGMVGLTEARIANKGIENGAKKVAEEGVCVDLEIGEQLLEIAVRDVVKDIGDLVNKK